MNSTNGNFLRIDQPYKQYNNIPNKENGLNYATWRPDALENNNLLVQENINSNWKYRRFLQNNAKILIPLNNEIELEGKFNHDCYDKSKLVDNVITYDNCLDFRDHKKMPYSDLKMNYIKKYEEACRSVCPKLTI